MSTSISQKRTADSTSTNTKKAKTGEEATMAAAFKEEQDPVNKGYALHQNITPISSQTFFSRSNPPKVNYIIKTRKYIDFNCCDTDQKAHIIPYRNLQWWIDKSTQNWKTWVGIQAIAYGFEIKKANFCIENHTVCRQRLIQQGQTNVLTYDFETSQNLIIGHRRNTWTYDTQPIESTSTVPTTRKTEEEFFNDITDNWTYEEVPQKHKWEWNVPIQKPHQHGILYKPLSNITPKHLLPGNNGLYIQQQQGQTQQIQMSNTNFVNVT